MAELVRSRHQRLAERARDFAELSEGELKRFAAEAFRNWDAELLLALTR